MQHEKYKKCIQDINKQKQTNSVALVRERTIPTERPPLVGEVNDNFCVQRVSRGQRNGPPRPYSRISRPNHLLPVIIKMLPNNNQVCALFTLFTTVASNWIENRLVHLVASNLSPVH
jgi:hypothetical protein